MAEHYNYYLLTPLILLCGYGYNIFPIALKKIIVFLVVYGFIISFNKTPYANFNFRGCQDKITKCQDNITQKILELTQGKGQIVVWGWNPKWNVTTQMPSATADNHTIWCFIWGDTELHRTRFLENIKKKKPIVFVNQKNNAFYVPTVDSVKVIASYIHENYRLVYTEKDYDIYLRNKN